MSSILKALKKLEHEKTSRIPDSLHIDSDILRSSDSSRSFSLFNIALMLLLVFGGGIAVAYFFLNTKKSPPTSTNPQQAITSKGNLQQVSPPLVKTENTPAEIVVIPAGKRPSGEALHKQQQKTPAVESKSVNIAREPVSADIPNSSEKPIEATETIKIVPADSAVPTLRVNGIAFQNNNADSMAIVNGVPVSSGSKIEGATVEEILKDRVLFNKNGETFEIQLGKSNR